MRRLIKKIVPCFATVSACLNGYRKPRFACHEKARTVDLEVFVPGVEAEGVDLIVDELDLVVTARKAALRALPVRTNWQAAHIEAVQQDYQLRVHLDGTIDPRSIWGALKHGVLTIRLRKTSQRAHPQLSVA